MSRRRSLLMALGGGSLLWTHKQRGCETIIIIEGIVKSRRHSFLMALGGGSLLWAHKQRRRETIIITERSSYEKEALLPNATRRGQLTVGTQTEKT